MNLEAAGKFQNIFKSYRSERNNLVGCGSLLTVYDLELNTLTFLKGFEPAGLDC